MADKFLNTYRIPSARAPWWDYRRDGCYFITICTANRECLFGYIEDEKMVLSDIGQIVVEEWGKSFEIRAELFCDAFVLMPNHLHAILRIDHMEGGAVDTHGRAYLPRDKRPQNHGVAFRGEKSISSFVACYKSSATKRINQYRNTPRKRVWQPRFHDHIIRNKEECKLIVNYIANNPVNWLEDENHPDKHSSK